MRNHFWNFLAGAIFAIVLCTAGMALAGFYTSGSGTVDDPYRISTSQDLQELSGKPADWDKHFVQDADLDVSFTAIWYPTRRWVPIGTQGGTEFTGTYNGSGHAIDGLVVNYEGMDTLAVGLFGNINGATIENLRVTNVDVTGSSYVGGLVGASVGSTIRDCHITGKVKGTGGDGLIGGIAGLGASTTITDSISECNVEGSNLVGGFMGRAYGGRIERSGSSGAVSGSGSAIGGFVGELAATPAGSGSIIDCYSTGDVGKVGTADPDTHQCTGGLVGKVIGGTVENSYSMSDVDAMVSRVGGLVGWNSGGTIRDSFSRGDAGGLQVVGGLVGENTGDIESSYSTGPVAGMSLVGGLIGLNDTGAVSDSFWNTDDVTGTIPDVGRGDSQGATGKTTQEMTNLSTFTDTATDGLETTWDFETVWRITSNNNDGYPQLLWQVMVDILDPSDGGGGGGGGGGCFINIVAGSLGNR